MWTLDQLVEKVRQALEGEYAGAPNGRVRDVPDRRAIRWYSTIGLVDKPLGMRGRTALYGPRHLQQLVAVKRLQAADLSLATIQEKLTGASPAELAEIAQVPPELLRPVEQSTPDAAATRPHFWAAQPSAAQPSAAQPSAAQPSAAQPSAAQPSAAQPSVAQPSVAQPSAAHTPHEEPVSEVDPVDLRPGDFVFPADPPVVAAGATAHARSFGGADLGGGVLLLVPHALSDRDLDAIAEAARPLLDLLTARGLTTAEGSTHGSPS
ncbi:MerR family transcriptional regulator [Paractinoplanes bogorensis]|uniref:MerR family transcriptional regulator n=1 Tax=Paractinoplanes bogorensis TaxID=1610840 RepID=UPI001FEAAD5C|nr:MerR family transcriptional regulator [Actinoplanes bogorensis]